MENFKKMVDEYSLEFEEHNRKHKGISITLEFSTSSENFEEKVDYLMNKKVKFGRWVIFKCSTCEGYDKDRPWHVTIEESLDWNEIQERTRELEIENFKLSQTTKNLLEEIEGKEYYPRGALQNFVDLFECLVENPEQYDEYVSATFIADTVKSMNGISKIYPRYQILEETLKDLLKTDERRVKFSQSVDMTIGEKGENRWNNFSEVNGGCCAYVDLRDFDYLAGKRVRVTVGVLEDK